MSKYILYYFLTCTVVFIIGIGSLIGSSHMRREVTLELRRNIYLNACNKATSTPDIKELEVRTPQEAYESPKDMNECIEWNEFLATQNSELRLELGIY